MRIQKVIGKFPGMRKDVDWVVYPWSDGATKFKIQSDTRIAMVDIESGKTCISKSFKGGAYFMHLSESMGAIEVHTPVEIISQLKSLTPTGPEVVLIGRGEA